MEVCVSDKTGYALGTLSAIIYFENKDGRIVLPGYDAGKPEQARKVFEMRFRHMGYDWREAGTLAEVDRLQTRMREQILREQAPNLERQSEAREIIHAQTASAMRQRMMSSSTTPYDRDFMELYLKLQETKRDKYRDAFDHRNMYLNIREQDSSKQFQDLAPDQPGDFWRTEAQQK